MAASSRLAAHGRGPQAARGAAFGIAIGILLLLAGRSPTAQPAQRIVSLVPALTEMLFEVGAGPEVVGVSSYDEVPAEVATRPRVGALIDPDVERMLALRPTLVVIYASQRDLSAQLARANIATYEYKHGGLKDIASTVRSLGARVGRVDRAEALARRIETAIASTRARVAGRSRPGTLLVFSREPGSLRSIYASGGVGFLHDLLEAAGARNVFADVARENVQATLEQVLARAPEVIIEVKVGVPPGAAALAVAADWRTLTTVPAVRDGRIHVWSDSDLVVPGPRIVEALERLARLAHR